LLKPTRIYVKPILSLLQALNRQPSAVKGIAHITGGAFFNKATKILPPSFSLAVERRSWPTPAIFKRVQEKAGLSEEEMLAVFNMGIGMVLVVERKLAPRIKERLSRYYATYVIGEVIKDKKKFVLR
jgi:phosphoribosylformylglycinamidine cyclo-ligase